MPPRLTDWRPAFWAKVDKTDGCWLWTGARSKAGYGSFGIYRKTKHAHRLAWELTNGPIPPGMVVRHICRNRTCVRHIELGTVQDNVRDQLRDGTRPFGVKHHNSLLTLEQVEAIRAECANGAQTQLEIGLKYGIARTTVSAIFHGRVWKK